MQPDIEWSIKDRYIAKTVIFAIACLSIKYAQEYLCQHLENMTKNMSMKMPENEK